MSESLRRQRQPRNPEELLFGTGPESLGKGDGAAKPSPTDPLSQEEEEEGTFVHAHALIYRAASLKTTEATSDALTPATRVAQGRGLAEPSSTVPSENPDRGQQGYRIENGELETATGYAIRFVPESMADLPIYDVLAAPTLESAPLPYQTLESLPPWARTKLRREGHLKCAGDYNRETNQFETFAPEWKMHPSNQADVLVQILEEVGNEHFVAAVYYFLHTHASEPNANPEVIASLRDIQPSSVMNSIREVQNRLETSSL